MRGAVHYPDGSVAPLVGAEEHLFEVEIRVTGVDPENTASVFREYKSQDAASADKAGQEILDGLSGAVKGRLTYVADPDVTKILSGGPRLKTGEE